MARSHTVMVTHDRFAELQFGKMRKVLEMDGGDGCTAMQCQWTVHLKRVKTVNFMFCIFYHSFLKIELIFHLGIILVVCLKERPECSRELP